MRIQKNLLTALIGLSLLVSCSYATEQLPPPPTTLPATPPFRESPTPTMEVNATATATNYPTPTQPQATATPWGYAVEENLDGSWYFEVDLYDGHYLKIFQQGIPDPIVNINLFQYYPEFPDTSSYPEFDNPSQSPGTELPHWSPDGRYLAFTGAIDGPSSDLYVFDTTNQMVRRLTSGSNQAAYLEWSPDSRWILHGEMSDFHCCSGYEAVWAARPDGSEVKWLFNPDGWSDTIGWVGNNSFFSADGSMSGYYILRLTNIDGGEVITIFDFVSDGVMVSTRFEFDPESRAVLYNLNVWEENLDYLNGGFYISTLSEPYPRLLFPYIPMSTEWDDVWVEELGLYVSSIRCNEDEEKYFAIDKITPEMELFCVEYNQ